jgi:hypothetical protein
MMHLRPSEWPQGKYVQPSVRHQFMQLSVLVT